MQIRPTSLSRTPAILARGNWLGALPVAVAVAGCSATHNPIQNVRSTYEHVDVGSNKISTLTNQLDVGVQDRVGPDFEYRFSDHFVQSSQSAETVAGSFDSDSTLHRPSLDLIVTSGTLRWTQVFQMQAVRTLPDNGADNTLVRNDVMEKLEWTPVDLPQVTGWFNYRTTEDNFFVDQERLEARVEVTQQIDTFRYEYSFRNDRTDDIDVDVQSDNLEHLGRLNYEDRFLEEKLSATFSLFASKRDNSTEVPSGTTPLVQVFPSQAFSAVDTTPQVSSLPQNGALIDGNLANSAGIDIGGFASGGQVSWNMAVQLPPGQTVDRLELATVALVPPNLVGQFSFSVWASDDNVFWTLVKSSAAYFYDPAFQRFRLSIPSVANRFVKVVNTASPAAAPAVLIAELEVFRASTAIGNNTSSFGDSVRNATSNVSWMLTDSVTVGVDLFLQAAESESNGTQTRDETRLDAGVWAAWAPTEKVDANVRASEQLLQDDVLRDEEVLNLLGVLSYHPIPKVDLDFSLLRTDRDIDGSDDILNDVANVLSSAELLPALRAEVSLERNTTEDATNQRDTERWIASAGLIAELTATLDATLRARNDDATVTGQGAAGVPDPSEDRYEATLVYRPSEHLVAEAELDWIENFAGSGLDQRLRLDWIPFGDGSLDTQFDFDRSSTQSFGDSQTDRWRATVRYGFNPYAYLELQYAGENPDTGPSTEVTSIAFSFSS